MSYVIQYHYDKNGKLVLKTCDEEKIYEVIEKDGLTHVTSINDYGDYDQEKVCEVYDASNKLIRKVVEDGEQIVDFIYDEKGLLVEEKWTDKNGTSGSVYYEYDDSNRKIKKLVSGKEGKLLSSYFEYGDDCVAERVMSKADRSRVYTSIITSYDNKGRVTSIENTHKMWDRTYTYDDEGHLINEAYCCGADGEEEEIIYDYDGDRLISKRFSDSEGNCVMYEYTYDSEGRLIAEEVTEL